MIWIYNFLLTILAVIWVPAMLIKHWRRREKPNWRERGGDYTIPISKNYERIWIHAVSVGEVVAAVPILIELKKKLPEVEIVLSTTTTTGRETARKRAAEWCDHLVYFPLDVVRFQLAAFSRVRPAVAAVMETELWPNYLWTAKTLESRTMVLNGRVNPRSYLRKLKLRWFYRWLFSMVDVALMQSERDVKLIKKLGAKNPVAVGNTKFDEPVDEAHNRKYWVEALGLNAELLTVVVGSTRGELEEELIWRALAQQRGAFNLVWAPRHLDRAEPIARMLTSGGKTPAFRSKQEQGTVVILDTIGELSSVYSAADVAIIGGGFGDFGGQSPIQPILHGVPVLHGRHMYNFADVIQMADDHGAAMECDAGNLGEKLARLLSDSNLRNEMREHAKKLAEQNRGAALRYAEAIAKQYEEFQREFPRGTVKP
jgi:3-deoxy-D-manno-octulosonic-acid transferase